MLPYLLLLSSFFSSVLSMCGSQPPTDADYVPLAVGSNRGPLTTVLNDAHDEGMVGLAIESAKEECDPSCLFTLDHYNAPHNHSSLVVRREMAELIPLGYTRTSNRSSVHCSRSQGECGATVPVWRHFALNGTGIYHTYTLDDSMVIGYTREAIPLCFVWAQEAVDQEGSGVEAILSSEERLKRNTVVRKDERSCEVSLPNRAKMEMLIEFKNNRTGSELDHFYTLKTSKELRGYNKTKDLGLIISTMDPSCSCLVILVQTLDNQTGVFHRIDHKLMREEAELNRIFEKYNRTGEKLYCAAQKGQCGASLPLYKHFDYIYIDSIITTSDKDIPPHSYKYPVDPLCWIWSASYDSIEEGSGEEGEITVDREKRSTEWEEEETEWRTDGWMEETEWTNDGWNTTTSNSSTRMTPTMRMNTTTGRMSTQIYNSTVRSTSLPPSPLALDEIIVRMVRSALGNDTNWRDTVRRKLRELSERI